MWSRYLLFNFLLLMISSCSGQDEFGSITEVDQICDWGVLYTEHSIQEPNWIHRVNDSEECKQWKAEHQKDFRYTIPDKVQGEVSLWSVDYKSTSLNSVRHEIRKFIHFTLAPKSDGDAIYGIDIYTALLAGLSYNAEYSYEPLKDTGDRGDWNLEVVELKQIVGDEHISLPEDYDEWAALHSEDLADERKSDNRLYRLWRFSMSQMSEDEIENQIVKIISWTQMDRSIDYKTKSYDTFKVTVQQNGSGETVVYSLNTGYYY